MDFNTLSNHITYKGLVLKITREQIEDYKAYGIDPKAAMEYHHNLEISNIRDIKLNKLGI